MQECTKVTAEWQTLAGEKGLPNANKDAKSQQKAWDFILAERLRDKLHSEAHQFARARLLSAAAPESGAWLRAIPAASLGTLLDSETLRITIALRVGADVCRPHRCKCGLLADCKGFHSLSCKFSAG